jgi:DNA repair exonuclease SbcCD ATPase subunit
MISKLRLPRYGHFVDTEFKLGQVTVFTGPNESGKSTIFDALFDSITAAPGTHTKVKANTSRYGTERLASIEGTVAPPEITPDEFLSILAVDSGDLTVPEGKGPWVDRLKAQLFTDGVDPRQLAGELKGEATERKNARHMRELQALIDRRKELTEARDQAVGRRSDMVRRRKEADSAKTQRQTLEKRLTEVIGERQRVATTLTAAEQQWRRRQLRQALGEIGTLREIEEELAASPLPGEEDLRQLAELTRRRDSAVSESEDARREADTSRARLEEEKAALASIEADAAALRQQVPVAQNLRDLLEKRFGARAHTKRAVTVASGILLMLLSTLGGVLLFEGAWAFGVATGGALVGLVMVLLGALRRGPGIGDIRDRWAAATGTAPLSEGAEGLSRELAGIESVLQHLEIRVAESRRSVDGAAKRLQEAEIRSRDLEESRRKALALLERWLSEHHVATPEEATHRGQRKRDLEQRRALLRGHLKPWQEELGVSDLYALQEELRAQLASLDALSAQAHLEEEDINTLRGRLSDLEGEEERLESGIRTLETEERTKRATYSEVFSGLPERILSLERELEAAESRITALTLRRRSAAIAAEIFEGLSIDATLELGSLAEELGQSYHSITGSDPNIVLETIGAASASAVDAGGVTRRIGNLSQGTKDVLMWTFRVAIAGKSRSEPAIFVLDDPFLAVDWERIGKCLRVLRETLLSEGWQIVLLTKDERLAEAAAALHPESIRHQLNRSGTKADS